MKTVDLLRHTANDGDELTPEGIVTALEIGRKLPGDYSLAVSTGAQRATQTIGCLLAGLGEEVPDGVVVVSTLRSSNEERWRKAYRTAGAGDLESLRQADPDFVAADAQALAAGLITVFSMLPDNGRALVVGHSPTNEAAAYGLTGEIVAPLGKGDRVVITQDAGAFSIHRSR